MSVRLLRNRTKTWLPATESRLSRMLLASRHHLYFLAIGPLHWSVFWVIFRSGLLR